VRDNKTKDKLLEIGSVNHLFISESNKREICILSNTYKYSVYKVIITDLFVNCFRCWKVYSSR